MIITCTPRMLAPALVALSLLTTAIAADTKPIAAPPVPATLMDTLVSAYLNNNELQARIHEAFKNHEGLSQAMAAFKPNISSEFTSGIQRSENQHVRTSPLVPDPNPPAQRRDRSHGRFHKMGLTVSQSLFRGGGDMAKLSAAEAQALAAYQGFLHQVQLILNNAIKYHMEVYYQRRNLDHSLNNLKFLREHAAAVRASVEVGDKTQTDIATAEARVAEAEAMLASAEAGFEEATAEYEAVVGKAALPNLEFPSDVAGLPTNEEDFINACLRSYPELLSAKFQERQAEKAIKDAEGHLWPQLSAEISGNRDLGRGNMGSRTRANTGQALLRLNVPIYQRGAEWSSIRAANEEYGMALNKRRQEMKKTRQQARAAWHNWNASKKRLKQYHAQVKAAKRSRDGALLEVKVGARANVEVLDAQRELLTAETNLEKARRDEKMAQFMILAMMGLLNPHHLGMPVEEYDIQGHADDVRLQWTGMSAKSNGLIKKVKGQDNS